MSEHKPECPIREDGVSLCGAPSDDYNFPLCLPHKERIQAAMVEAAPWLRKRLAPIAHYEFQRLPLNKATPRQSGKFRWGIVDEDYREISPECWASDFDISIDDTHPEYALAFIRPAPGYLQPTPDIPWRCGASWQEQALRAFQRHLRPYLKAAVATALQDFPGEAFVCEILSSLEDERRHRAHREPGDITDQAISEFLEGPLSLVSDETYAWLVLTYEPEVDLITSFDELPDAYWLDFEVLPAPYPDWIRQVVAASEALGNRTQGYGYPIPEQTSV